MTIPGWPGTPDWPDHTGFPYPPARTIPRREGPVAVPMVDLPSASPDELLRRQRRVLCPGPLDAATATRVTAELMALDGRSADDVELVVNSEGGPLADVLVILDVIGLMRAQVDTLCIGRASGTAAIVLACGSGQRRVAARATVTLRVRQDERVEGSVADVRRQLDELAHVRTQVIALVVAATGMTEEEVQADLDVGRPYEATAAVRRGLADEVAGGTGR
ncbi:MAG: ATP-dependent Clp protease proteolytic subunit [Ilumatobacteraceae bacterium]